MKVYLVLFLLLIVSNSSFARTDCPLAKVTHIQIERGKILYQQEGFNWRVLGSINEDGTKERYAALLAAQMSGKHVLVGYARDDYNCNTTNYSESAILVRTYNN